MRVIMLVITLAIGGLVADAAVGRGTFKSGNDLLALCEAVESEAAYFQKTASCRGYVTGVLDYFWTINALEGPARSVCMPANLTVGQAADIVTKHLKANPEIRHLTASMSVISAMVEAFPCAK